jgi:uncharacterized protein YggE
VRYAISLAVVLASMSATFAADPGVHVSGSAVVKVVPDEATIGLGVTTRAKTANQALSENNSKMEGVFATLSKSVSSKDFTTSGISLQPIYQYLQKGEERRVPEFLGYEASNNIVVKVRNLKSLGEILDKAVSSGANNVQYVQFIVSDLDKRMNEGRTAAVANAKSKAQLLLNGVGGKVGKVLSITEHSSSDGGFRPRTFSTAMAADGQGGAVPTNPGEREVTVLVGVSFAIEN